MEREERSEVNDKKQKQIYDQMITVIEGRVEVSNKKQRREEKKGGPSTVSCDVCMDVISVTDSIHVPKCHHRFCGDCIGSHLQKKIQENVRQVKCPSSKCRAVLKPEFCSNLIPEKVYERWTNALTEIYALENAREIECPSDDCEGVFTVDRRGFGTKRLCSKCGGSFCLRCRSELLYTGFSCKICERTRRLNQNHRRNRGSKTIHHI